MQHGYTRLVVEFSDALPGADLVRAGLNDLASSGCILRDLDLGLVDFYTMAKDRVVCLCWRRGEPCVTHWHPTDEGFSGRRPLAELP